MSTASSHPAPPPDPSGQNQFFKLQASAGWLSDLSKLSLLLISFFGFLLGTAPLAVPDGGRYAEIAREMVTTHQYLIPHLNGAIYFEKPPLFYWLQSLSIHWFGLSEWSLRFWIACFAWLGCLGNYTVGRLLMNRRVAWLASLLLASNLLYFIMARQISLDMALSFWLTVALYGFLLWTRSPQHQSLLYLAYLAVAAAILTKGFIGLLLPMLIIGLWICFTWQWTLIPRMCLPSGLAFVTILVFPWHAYVQWHYPFFLKFYLLDQQILRYTTHISDRAQPWWFYGAVILIGFYPSWIFIPSSWRSLQQRWQSLPTQLRQHFLFLLIWIVATVLFFSCSHSKLIPYILPICAPFALCLALGLASQFDSPLPPQRLLVGLLAFTSLSITLAFAILWQRTPWLHQASTTPWLFALLTSWLVSAGSACCQFSHGKLRQGVSLSLISTGLLCLCLALIRPHLDTRPIKPLALILKTRLDANKQAGAPPALIASFGRYYQDLPFYTQQTVLVVNSLNEFELANLHQDLSKRFLRAKDFWQLWKSKQQVYMIADSGDLEQIRKVSHGRFSVIARQHSDFLLINNAQQQFTRP